MIKEKIHPMRQRWMNALEKAMLAGKSKLAAELILFRMNHNVKKIYKLILKAEALMGL